MRLAGARGKGEQRLRRLIGECERLAGKRAVCVFVSAFLRTRARAQMRAGKASQKGEHPARPEAKVLGKASTCRTNGCVAADPHTPTVCAGDRRVRARKAHAMMCVGGAGDARLAFGVPLNALKFGQLRLA